MIVSLRSPAVRLGTLLLRAGLAVTVVATVAMTGCNGSFDDASGPAGPGTSPPSDPASPNHPGATTPGPSGDPNAAGPMPLRRLTQREYNNTVRDLLSDTSKPANGFPIDRDSDFQFRRAGLVSQQDYTTIRDAAEALGAAAEKNLASLAPCTGGGEEACAKDFIAKFGQRAYRRPLLQTESDDLFALYKTGRSTLMLDHAGAIRLVIEGLLQAPAFLYHWETGPGAAMEGGVLRLGPYEIASRLSYFLWGSMPDQALFDAAAAGKLGSAGEIDSQARRMLSDGKARETLAAFAVDWLGLDRLADRPKDPAVYPEYKDDVKAAMLAETPAFVTNVVFDGDGHFATLLTASYSFVNQALGPIYGMKNVAGPDLSKTNLDPGQRSGLLTQGAFLAVTGATNGSNPAKRGRKVLERMLCGTLPDPPANVPPFKPASEGGTTRERFSEHSANGCAKVCHVAIDPIGFTFENYDGVGKFRTMDNGKPVDASGAITLDGVDKKLNNARELSQALAVSNDARLCFATQLFRFAMVRNEDDADRASIEAMNAAFSKNGYTIKDALIGLATARSFRYRTPAQGETLP